MAAFSPFYKVGVFTFSDVMHKTGLSRAGTSTALSRWESQGLLETVRRIYVYSHQSVNGYACV